MSPPERESRPAGHGAAPIKSLVRDDSNHTARTDKPRDLLHDTGGA
jgi:hypothetical protein